MRIVVIDYGLCNLKSVSNAFNFIGVESIVTDRAEDISGADALILPGVGAFEDGMSGLRKKGMVGPINDFVTTGRPFLGICLGMQLLMNKSYEFGEHQGLELIPGEVVSFKHRMLPGPIEYKVPHIGWNGLFPKSQHWKETILDGLKEGTEMYFVHSFYVHPTDSKYILAETEYANRRFCSVIRSNNIFGCQFHPEKSSENGLKILKNFVDIAQASLDGRSS